MIMINMAQMGILNVLYGMSIAITIYLLVVVSSLGFGIVKVFEKKIIEIISSHRKGLLNVSE